MTWPDRIPLELTEEQLLHLQYLVRSEIAIMDRCVKPLAALLGASEGDDDEGERINDLQAQLALAQADLLEIRKKLRAAQIQAFTETFDREPGASGEVHR